MTRGVGALVGIEMRIDQDQVVGLRRALEVFEAVRDHDAGLRALAGTEEFARHGHDRRIDLDHVDLRLGKQRVERRRNGTAAQPDDKYAFRPRFHKQADKAHARVIENEFVRIFLELAALVGGVVPARRELHADLLAVVGHGDVPVQRFLGVDDFGGGIRRHCR